MKLFNICSAIILLSAFHWACDPSHEHSADTHTHEATSDDVMDSSHADEEEQEVGLTTDQMQKINLQLGTFVQKNLDATLKVNGKLELPPQNKADVSPMGPGRVSRIAVELGQYVGRGAVLATLHYPELINWQQEYLEVKGALLYLDKEYERQKELVDREIAPRKQVEKMISERAIAQAKLKGLKARLEVFGIAPPDTATAEFQSHFTVSSPISGYVRNINVNTGKYVDAQQTLFEIVDNQKLHIDFLIFEKDLPKVSIGQIIYFNLQSQPKNVMRARIFAIGKALNEADRTVSVHAEIIDKKTELVTGMFVEGRIVLKDQTVAALPEEAITIDKGLHYIFIQMDTHEGETHFKKFPVLKGLSDQGFVTITPMEPLPDDPQIVTEGAYFLMAQSKKGEQGAGHHH